MSETSIRLEFSEGGSHKFWQIQRRGSEVVTVWGRIGTAGQVQAKAFGSESEAESFVGKQAAAKRKKGYAEVASASPGLGQSPGHSPGHSPGQSPGLSAGHAAQTVKSPAKSAGKASAAKLAGVGTDSAQDGAPAVLGSVLWTARQRAARLRYGGFYVSSDAHQKLFSSDKYPWTLDLRAIPPDASAALEILRPRLRHCLLEHKERIEPALAEHLAALRRLALPDRDSEPLSLAEAALGLTLLPVYDQALTDWLMLTQGAAFAAEALLAAQDYKRADSWDRKSLLRKFSDVSPIGFSSPPMGFVSLHRWLREIPLRDPAYLAARDQAGQLRARLGARDRVLLSFLFCRERAWLEAEARAWLALDITGLARVADNRYLTSGLMGHWYAGWLLWPLLADPELQAAYAARLGTEDEGNRHRLLDGLRVWAGWAVELLGAAAAPLLAALTAGGEHAEDRRAGAELLALIHDPRAYEAMAGLLLSKEGQKYFLPRFTQHPELGVPALLRAVCARPRQAELRRQLENLIQLAEPGLLASLSLPEAEAALLASLSSQAGPAAPVAALETLPELLRNPPWQRKLAAGPALPRLDLRLPLAEERIAWLPEDEPDKIEIHDRHRPLPHPDRDAARLEQMQQSGHDVGDLDCLTRDCALARFNSLLPAGPALSYRPGPLASLAKWQRVDAYHLAYELPVLLKRFGPDGLPGLIALASKEPKSVYPYLARIVSPRLAYAMNRGLDQPGVRSICWAWIQRYPRETALGLIAIVLSGAEQAAWCASQLRRLALQPDFSAAIQAAAAEYGREAERAVAALLAVDPLSEGPAKAPPLPGFFDARLLSAPVLRASGEALPATAVATCARLLSLGELSLPHPGVAELKALCTPESLDAFAWSLTRLWLDQGAPKAQAWMLGAIAQIGGEASLAQLLPLLEKWPGERAHPRAIMGLDVLVGQGSVKALAGMLKIARKCRFPALKEAAGERLREVAAARGLSPEALFDRLVPDHGFDPAGTRDYLLEGQVYQVLIDGALKAQLADQAGQVLAKLPKATPKDAEKAWKAFKKELEATLRLQAERLETAMCDGLRWSLADFSCLLLEHPLMGLLARRLLWALWLPEAEAASVFEILGEAWCDLDGPVLIPAAGAEVSLAHPLHFYPERAEWQRRWADRSAQPFEQIARAVWFPSPEDYARLDASRFKSRKVPSGALLALQKRGWKKEDEAGFAKRYGAYKAELSTGYYSWAMGMVGDVDISDLEITSCKTHKKVPPAALDPLSFSELLRDLEYLEGPGKSAESGAK